MKRPLDRVAHKHFTIRQSVLDVVASVSPTSARYGVPSHRRQLTTLAPPPVTSQARLHEGFEVIDRVNHGAVNQCVNLQDTLSAKAGNLKVRDHRYKVMSQGGFDM